MKFIPIVLLLGLSLLAGCGKKESASGDATQNAPLPEPPLVVKCEPGVRGGRLVIAQLGDPKTFNPITANETSSTDVLLRMFAGLTAVDVPTQTFSPALAESWTVGADNLTFFETTPGWGMAFCRTCGSTLCGTSGEAVHGVTLGSVDGDPGVRIEMHLFVGSKAPWDHIGGDAPQYEEFPPGMFSG